MATTITFSTVYGSSELYARRLASSLDLEARDVADVSRVSDGVLVHFGGLYAGTVCGLRRACALAKPPVRLVVCTVGLADPGIEDNAETIDKTVRAIVRRDDLVIFHLRGRMDYRKLSVKHRAMMWALVKVLMKSKKELSDEDRALIGTYGKTIDFVDESWLDPVRTYLSQQLE